MNTVLELDHIQTYIGRFHILEDVSLSVPEGKVTVMLGRNGAGKTTTLRTIMGLTPPHSGSINFAGQSIGGKHTYDIATLGIGYVPEDRAIFSALTVEENLMIAERRKGDLARKSDLLFGLFPDLQRLYGLKGTQLSGGQQQMLAIARALVPDNQLLLIDEPTKGLAPILVENVMQAIQQLKTTTTVLLVEQNFHMASDIGDLCYIIDAGRTVHHGAMAEVAADEALIQQYLGAT
jgi:branched-chain amino acid transport system ATP-binding protein